jgi:uncharacterized protein (TIGR02145 family)
MKKTIIILSVLAAILSSCGVLKKSATHDKGVVINGVRWATRNVDEFGTFAKTSESAGKFYQWNRKKAWNTTDKKVTDWDDTTPEGNVWEKANDPSPKGWRIPTFEEIRTLLDTKKVSSEWTTQNGVKGRKFTDKATGNSIFLPAAGFRWHSDGILSSRAGSYGDYWSSTPNFEKWAKSLYFLYRDPPDRNNDFRGYGRSVRAVAE